MFSGQAFDSQGIGDPFFKLRFELFKVLVQDYREAFKRSIVPQRDQGFSLRGQMCDFLHQLLRRVGPRNCLPDECDWDALRSFDSAAGRCQVPLILSRRRDFGRKR